MDVSKFNILTLKIYVDKKRSCHFGVVSNLERLLKIASTLIKKL